MGKRLFSTLKSTTVLGRLHLHYSALTGIALVLLLSACSGRGSFPHSSGTTVDLSRKNYRMVKSNAVGSSTGFSLLGIIPFSSPSYSNAMSDLYQTARVKEGSATALVNITEEESSLYLILFSIPKLRVRADVIEFTDEQQRKSSVLREDRSSGTRESVSQGKGRNDENPTPPAGQEGETAPTTTPQEQDLGSSPYDRY